VARATFILVYILYVAVAMGLTIWLARTLFRNGTVFLQDVFEVHRERQDLPTPTLATGFVPPAPTIEDE
jgi:hypothetical protein